nr:hypothetical protein [Tanacetum cinerariifolium]
MKSLTLSENHKHNTHFESENDTKFNKSLHGLKDLCAQLHHAADSYQSSFLNSNQKQLVIKDTKEYVYRALVTVVDHLGSVSAKLDQHLSKVDSIYQTDAKLSLLNLKLLTCQDYSHKIARAKVSKRENNLKYNSRYIKPSISDVLKQNESFSEPKCGKVDKSANENHEFKVDEEVPLFLYTCNHYKASSLLEASKSVLPVRDHLALQPKSECFQLQGHQAEEGTSRKRLGSRHARGMSGSPELRRDRSKSHGKKDSERRTMFKRLEKVVAQILKAATRVLAQKKQSLLSKNIITKQHPHEGRKRCQKAKAAAKTERWAMPTWCHMFNFILTRNARVWFDDLPTESIDSYDDLKEAFLENYLQQKNASKIWLKFTISSREMGNPRNNSCGARQKPNFKKGSFRNQQRPEQKQDRSTLLTKTPKEILALDKGKFKPPPPMITSWRNNMAARASIAACKDRRRGTFNVRMDEFHGCKVTISMQQNNKEARSKENPSSAVYNSRNAKIPSGRRNDHIMKHGYDWGPTLHSKAHVIYPRRMYTIRQKKRGQAPKRNKAIYEEVEKMVNAGIMKEVHYHSWLMELYMMNRQHGQMILESVENGPLIWPTIKENGVTRPRKYSELSTADAIQVDCDVKATNIILQGLPPELRNSSNPRQQATINDGRVTLQPVHGRQISFATGTTRTYKPGASGSNSRKQMTVICYNCKGEGHMSKQYTKPKRKQDDSWFKDKVLLVKEKQENDKIETKPDKNEKRGEAQQCQGQSQSRNKKKKKIQSSRDQKCKIQQVVLLKEKEKGWFCNLLKVQLKGAKLPTM